MRVCILNHTVNLLCIPFLNHCLRLLPPILSFFLSYLSTSRPGPRLLLLTRRASSQCRPLSFFQFNFDRLLIASFTSSRLTSRETLRFYPRRVGRIQPVFSPTTPECSVSIWCGPLLCLLDWPPRTSRLASHSVSAIPVSKKDC